MTLNLKKRALISLLINEEEEENELFFVHSYFKREPDSLFTSRLCEGAYENLIKKQLMQNDEEFRQYFRLSIELFSEVFERCKEDISFNPYNRRKNPITKEEKLCITLRFLATGESYRSLSFQFRISHCHISAIINEVLGSICKNLMPIYMPSPSTALFEEAAKFFQNRLSFPNCCGAIDGKHVRVVCPKNSSNAFFNKDFFSTVLLALVDGQCRFIVVDIGPYGREGDSGIFLKSQLRKNIISGRIGLPQPKLLPKANIVNSHVILGDAAFVLTENIMKPYPEKQVLADRTKALYNYRHCHARRCSENAFGIMSQYFRVFFSPIAVNINTVDKLVLACCLLHNMLRTHNVPYPQEETGNLELPTRNLISLASSSSRRSSFEAERVRDNFRRYFLTTEGATSGRLMSVYKLLLLSI